MGIVETGLLIVSGIGALIGLWVQIKKAKAQLADEQASHENTRALAEQSATASAALAAIIAALPKNSGTVGNIQTIVYNLANTAGQSPDVIQEWLDKAYDALAQFGMTQAGDQTVAEHVGTVERIYKAVTNSAAAKTPGAAQIADARGAVQAANGLNAAAAKIAGPAGVLLMCFMLTGCGWFNQTGRMSKETFVPPIGDKPARLVIQMPKGVAAGDIVAVDEADFLGEVRAMVVAPLPAVELTTESLKAAK